MNIDYRNPDYAAIMRERMVRLRRLRERMKQNPTILPSLKNYYRINTADFIADWGMTFDPRNADIGLPTVIPFIPFPRQRELVGYILRKWKERSHGLVEKSRDAGASYIAIGVACTLCLFEQNLAIGFGSRKEEYVDKIGQPKSLFWKARLFMDYIPREFKGEWEAWRDAPFMRIQFPETGSVITGEAGDQIGRGDRAAIYVVDEGAHLERPELVDMALSQTTNCRIDISSVNGMNNPFARKRFEGKIEPFIFDWRDDPRKDEAWYQKQCDQLDPVVVAQEIDRDYSASVSGIVIPAAWVKAAIGAKEKLGIAPSGSLELALDVADEGVDKNAVVGAHGTTVDYVEEWSGKGGDIYQTCARVFQLCDERGYAGFRYDADGLGAGIRGDARNLNALRGRGKQLIVDPFRGSESPFDPDGIVDGTQGGGGVGRTNKDYFANRKAQGWWSLRKRFQKTHRWVVEGIACPPDDIISLDKDLPLLHKLVTEVSQPTYAVNQVGKIVINKKPDGMKSPNCADALMIKFASIEQPAMRMDPGLLNRIRAMGQRRRP